MSIELKQRETKDAIARVLGLPTQWLISFTVKVCRSGPLQIEAEYYVPETEVRCTRMTFVGSADAISQAVAAFGIAAEMERQQ